jgi:ribosomal protein S18 acetylase RimI-like enzyme
MRVVETRITTDEPGSNAARVVARATWQQALLVELGFERGSARVEYKMRLTEALARLESSAKPSRLSWVAVQTEPGPALERAARVLRAAGEGALDAAEYEDAEGYLLSRRDDHELVLPPESLQIGVLDDHDVAIVAASVVPTNGWCSLFHLGVVPSSRGQGLGTEAMRHGLRAMRTMAGVTYHDGTDTRNEAMRAMFERIGAPVFRAIEQWTLRL